MTFVTRNLVFQRTAHFMSWIYHSLPHFLLLICIMEPYGFGYVISPKVTSKSYSLTLSFEPNPAATNYTASFSVYKSWRLSDFALEPPYNGSITVVYDEAIPGLNYTVQLFENETSENYRVFSQHIATVPLAPINVEVQDSGTNYLDIKWDSERNSTYPSHRIYYRQSNEASWSHRNGTAEQFYTLEGLNPGYLYHVFVTAVAFDFYEDKESLPSTNVSSPTLPVPPTNVSAEAVNTTHITVSWTPQASSYQDSFRVNYLFQGANTTADCQQSPCSFAPGPPAGREVIVFISSISHSVTSMDASIKCSTEPEPVTELKAKSGTRSLNLTWMVPANVDISSYYIRVVNMHENLTRNYTKIAVESGSLVEFPLTGLIGGSYYQVFVSAETPYAKGEADSKVFSTEPEPVTNLNGSAINTTAILLSWANPLHTAFDEIHIAVTKPDGNVVLIKEVETATDRVVIGLIPGETYQISVIIHTPHHTLVSKARSVTVTTQPVKPRVVSSMSQERSISVTLSRDEELGNYTSIEASIKSGSRLTASSDGVVQFDKLAPGTEYMVEMVTKSGQVESDPVTVNLYTKPRPPQLLSIDVLNSTSIRVSWDKPDDGGFDNFTVTVEESDGGSQELVKTTSEFEVDFNNVIAGTTYNVSIITIKGDQVSTILLDQNTTAPLSVADIRVWIRGIDSVTLTWEPPVGSALEGYALTFDLSNVTLLELPASTTQYKLEGLEPDTNYTIQIFTFTLRPVGGVKLYSLPRRFNFSTYPESVAALQKVEASTDTITVNWTDPLVGDFNLYQLGIKEEDTNRQSRPLSLFRNTTNTTFQGLLPGKVYIIAIRTILRLPSGRERFGISVRLRAVTDPLPVDDLEVTTVNTTSIQISWRTNETSSQDKFLITYVSGGLMKTTETIASNASQEYAMTISQLLSGSEYHVEVVAIRSIPTDSEDSRPVTQEGFTRPMAVSNVTLIPQMNSAIAVSWTAPLSDGRVDSYRIRYRSILRDPNTEFLLSSSDQTSKNLVNLFPGEKYEVQVVAVSNNLESEEINKTIVLRPLPPASVGEIKDKAMTNSVTVEWSYDADRYYCQKWIVMYTDGGAMEKSEEVMRTDVKEYRKVITGLTPGQTYSISIKSDILNQTSDIAALTATAKPVLNTALEESATTNDSITFTYTIKTTDKFDSFVFYTNPGDGTNVTVLKNVTLNIRTISNLEGGSQYSLQARALSNSVLSDPVSINFITDPNPVLVELNAKASEITLNLGTQKGGAATYTILCRSDTTPSVSCGTKSVPVGSKDVTFSNLIPYSDYHFEVTTFTVQVGGRTKEAKGQYKQKTAQAAPSKVLGLTLTEKSIHSVVVSWQEPAEINGVLENYIVSYRGREVNYPDAEIDQGIKVVNPPKTSEDISNLKAGYSYVFQVFGQTVANSTPAEKEITMKTALPTFKPNVTPESSKPNVPKSGKNVTLKTISLQFTNPFSSDNGFVRYYSVIVSRDVDADDSSPNLPSWEDAKKDKSIMVYQAVAKCEDFFASTSKCGISSSTTSTRKRRAVMNDMSSRNFLIGAQTAAECEGQANCNGPLSEGTTYYVKLRGFTASGKFQDTEYSEKIRTAENSPGNGGMIGGVIGGILAIALVAVVVVVYIKWRRRPKKATKHAGSKTTWEQSTMNKFSRPVKLAYFPDHVRKMAADSDFKYAEEYEDLKEVGRDQPTLAAEFPPNRPKNRFTNILPYDHSRVKLLPTDDEEGSDYINANYMPGYSSKREYIATQGPLPATRDDFWRMLWEQCSRNIIMLTKCHEKGREKSDHYWPNDQEPKFYGDLQVVVLNETKMPDWTIVEFKVSHGDQSRQVRHFHYLAWPDFGVPKDPASLIRFVRTVREKLIREGGPTIAHCSAGVGRSGTFIVLDHLLQLIREQDEIDIFSIVYKLRKERVLMVQTEQQYKFIHECLLCVLENRENDTTYANLGQINVGFEDDEGINLEGP